MLCTIVAYPLGSFVSLISADCERVLHSHATMFLRSAKGDALRRDSASEAPSSDYHLPQTYVNMSDSEADPGFTSLPARLQRRIDRAFDSVARHTSSSDDTGTQAGKRKRYSSPRTASIPTGAGGFIAEDSPAPGGFIADVPPAGGFIPDDSMDGGFIPESPSAPQSEGVEEDSPLHYIPLSAVPSALQLLDLQPDDEDVLSVFRNAATGWENRHSSRAERQDDTRLLVSRKDWRAVCAALMDSGGDNDGDGDEGEIMEDVEMIEGNDGPYEEVSDEEYMESGEGSGSEEADDSDDEYTEGGFVRPKSRPGKSETPNTFSRGRKRRNVADSSLSPLDSGEEADDFSGSPKRITARQKAESRRAFALFFPDVPDQDLDKQRLMIKDIARVAALLREKLTAEDVRACGSSCVVLMRMRLSYVPHRSSRCSKPSQHPPTSP